MSLMKIAKKFSDEFREIDAKNEALRRDRRLRAEEHTKETLSKLLGIEVQELFCVENYYPGLYTVVVPVGHGFSIVSHEPVCIGVDDFEREDDISTISWNVVLNERVLRRGLTLKGALASVWEAFEAARDET